MFLQGGGKKKEPLIHISPEHAVLVSELPWRRSYLERKSTRVKKWKKKKKHINMQVLVAVVIYFLAATCVQTTVSRLVESGSTGASSGI